MHQLDVIAQLGPDLEASAARVAHVRSLGAVVLLMIAQTALRRVAARADGALEAPLARMAGAVLGETVAVDAAVGAVFAGEHTQSGRRLVVLREHVTCVRV